MYSTFIPTIPNPGYGIACSAKEQGECILEQLKGVDSLAKNIQDKCNALELETQKQYDENKKEIKKCVDDTTTDVIELKSRNDILLAQYNKLMETTDKMEKIIDQHEKEINKIICFLDVASNNITKKMNELSVKVGIEPITMTQLGLT